MKRYNDRIPLFIFSVSFFSAQSLIVFLYMHTTLFQTHLFFYELVVSRSTCIVLIFVQIRRIFTFASETLTLFNTTYFLHSTYSWRVRPPSAASGGLAYMLKYLYQVLVPDTRRKYCVLLLHLQFCSWKRVR